MKDSRLKAFTKWVDDQIDFKSLIGGIVGNVAEMADGPIFSVAINLAFSKVPEEHQEEVLNLMDAIVRGNYQAISVASVDHVVSILKTPLGDEKEKIIIGGLVEIAFDLIRHGRQSA